MLPDYVINIFVILTSLGAILAASAIYHSIWRMYESYEEGEQKHSLWMGLWVMRFIAIESVVIYAMLILLLIVYPDGKNMMTTIVLALLPIVFTMIYVNSVIYWAVVLRDMLKQRGQS